MDSALATACMYDRLITVATDPKEASRSVADIIQAQESDSASTDSCIRDVAPTPNKVCLTNIAGCFLSGRCHISFARAARLRRLRGAALFTKTRRSTQV